MEQQLPTLPRHLISTPIFCEVRVAQSFVFCVAFSRSLFVILSTIVLCLRILVFPLVIFKLFLYQWSWILLVTDFSNLLALKKMKYAIIPFFISFVNKGLDAIHVHLGNIFHHIKSQIPPLLKISLIL